MALLSDEKRSNLYQNIAAWLITFAILGLGFLYFDLTHNTETPGKKAERIKPILLSKAKAQYCGKTVEFECQGGKIYGVWF